MYKIKPHEEKIILFSFLARAMGVALNTKLIILRKLLMLCVLMFGFIATLK